MRIILLMSSHSQSIYKIFRNSLTKIGHDVKLIDSEIDLLDVHEKLFIKLNNRIGATKIKAGLIRKQRKRKNDYFLNEINLFQPDVVISYNDSYLLPDIIDKIKQVAKFLIYLGDNPFYSFFKNDFLQIVLKADVIITPDTGCQEQLITTGAKNCIYEILGVGGALFKKVALSPNDIANFSSEVFYLGSIHGLESWAFKRPLMLQNFITHDLKIFGNLSWNKILPLFPDLINHFTLINDPMSDVELNLRMNCSKIYPIDAHPGIIKGLHARVFDVISSEILPIVEYREDLNIIFKDVKPPSFKNFDEAKKHADHFINNDNHRERLSQELHQYLFEHYKSEDCINRMLSYL
jgi:hypothetical protein